MNQATNTPVHLKSRYYILVEGNIAVGKSTFINRLEEKLGHNATVFNEPVDRWTNLRGTNLLKEMYHAPSRNSFAIQSYIQLTMAMTQQSMIYRPIRVMERSLNSGRKVFTEAMMIQGHINRTEYNILDEWYQWLDQRNIPTNQIVYLRSTPDLALKRLRERNRPEESNVNLDYLTLIHDLHENWLIHRKPRNLPPVKIIDQNRTLEETLRAADQLAHELKLKIFPHLLC